MQEALAIGLAFSSVEALLVDPMHLTLGPAIVRVVRSSQLYSDRCVCLLRGIMDLAFTQISNTNMWYLPSLVLLLVSS